MPIPTALYGTIKFRNATDPADLPKFGIRYLLWENKVAGFVISSPLEMILFDGDNWVSCD